MSNTEESSAYAHKVYIHTQKYMAKRTEQSYGIQVKIESTLKPLSEHPGFYMGSQALHHPTPGCSMLA